MDWRKQIVELVLVKKRLHELDTKNLWEYRLPHVGAAESALVEVETKLGAALDPLYRAFLTYANGWPAFHQAVDLFGTEDLLGGPRMTQAMEYLGYIEESVLVDIGFRRDELLPIAATSEDMDLFVMPRRSTSPPGTVIWLAGREIDRFPSFDEYFLAMVDYERLEVGRLQQAQQATN